MQHYDTFLSYSHEDRDRAAKVKSHLEKSGFKVWKDDRISLGTNFRSAIAEGIDRSESITTLLTENSLRSEEVFAEVRVGLQKQKKIIPVVLSPRALSENGKWRNLLRNLNWGHVRSAARARHINPTVLREIERALHKPHDRGCPVIAVYNFKGGVGKTTLSAHLAAQLYRDGGKPFSVLMIDCDAQSNLSSLFISRRELQQLAEAQRNLIGLLEPDRLMAAPDSYGRFEFAGGQANRNSLFATTAVLHRNQKTEKQFSLIPNWIDAKKYGHILSEDIHGKLFQNFQNSIQGLSYDYDFIILDCNPSASPLSRFALEAATDILVPFQCDKYALDGLERIDALLSDFYQLTYGYGPMEHAKQLWTVANFAKLPKISESNAKRAEAQDAEALVFRELLSEELIGGRSLAHFKPSLLDTRIPESGHLNPRPASTGPRQANVNPAETLQSFVNFKGTEAPAKALKELARELADKALPKEVNYAAI